MFRCSTLQKEGPLLVSKWLAVQVLLSPEELSEFLFSLETITLANTASLCSEEEMTVPVHTYVKWYSDYLTSGNGALLACALTSDVEALYAVSLPDERWMVKACRPVVQIQAHKMHYSEDDNTFRPMISGEGTIAWGLQLSYPQIYQNFQTKEILKVDTSFPNTLLFRKVQKWMRSHSEPTPLCVSGEHITIPIRIGKRCTRIHPELASRGITIR